MAAAGNGALQILRAGAWVDAPGLEALQRGDVFRHWPGAEPRVATTAPELRAMAGKQVWHVHVRKLLPGDPQPPAGV